MPRNGSGTFIQVTPVATGPTVWADTKAAGNTIITTADHDFHDQDQANALTASIANDGQTPILANIPFGGHKITNLGPGTAATDAANLTQLQNSEINWVVTGGSANALTATYSPPITVLTDGQECAFRASLANTTTTPTFSPNGLTAHPITYAGGAAISATAWAINSEILIRYNLANTRWEMISAPIIAGVRSGGTVTSPMSMNVVLTASSNQILSVAPDAGGRTIQLPDATGFTTPVANIFEFNNLTSNGKFPVSIIDSASNIIGWLLPGGPMMVHLDSIGSATGNWRLQTGDRRQDNGFYEWGAPMYFATNALTYPVSAQLDSQFGIAVYTQSSTIKAVGYKLTDAAPQVGGSSTVDSTSPAGSDVIRLSPTLAFVAYLDGTNGLKCATISLNTSTLGTTVNTAITIDAAATTTNAVSVDMISPILAIVTWVGSSATKVVTVSISGTTCTANTPANVAASAANRSVAIVVLSTTLAHFASTLSGASTMSFVRIVLSGTTISSVGTPVTQAGRDPGVALSKVSATVSGATYIDSATESAVYGNVLTDTGSTITTSETLLVPPVVGGAGSSTQFTMNVATLSGNGAIVWTVDIAAVAPMFIVKFTTSAATISPALMPSTTFSNLFQSQSTIWGAKTFNNLGAIIGAFGGATAKGILQPFAWA